MKRVPTYVSSACLILLLGATTAFAQATRS
jgi:hypothetical protein